MLLSVTTDQQHTDEPRLKPARVAHRPPTLRSLLIGPLETRLRAFDYYRVTMEDDQQGRVV